MRVVLLGGLTAVLVALVVTGGWMVNRETPRPAGPEDEDEPEPPQAPVGAGRLRRAARPERVVADPLPCTPMPGGACWRGRIVLSDSVWRLWRAEEDARDARAAAWDTAGVVEGEPEPDPEPEPTREAALRRFQVVARQRSDPPPDLAVEVGDDGKPVEHPVAEADVGPDGSFVVQVAPGRYDLEVESDDQFLAGGLDGIVARAGAAEAGAEVVVSPGLTITGRVLDAAETGAPATVRFKRAAQYDSGYRMSDGSGHFEIGGLRPGTYQLLAEGRGLQSRAVEAQASAQGVRLAVTWAPRGLLLVAPRDNGRCPLGTLDLREERRLEERLRFDDCQAAVGPIEPGKRYQVKGVLAGRTYDATVVFQGPAPAPVCLDTWCGIETGQLRVRVVDGEGTSVAAAAVSMCEETACEDLWVASRGEHGGRVRPGARLMVRARSTEDERVGETAVLVVPGLNEVVVRLRRN